MIWRYNQYVKSLSDNRYLSYDYKLETSDVR